MDWNKLSAARVRFDGWNQRITLAEINKIRAWIKRQRPVTGSLVIESRDDNTYYKGYIELGGNFLVSADAITNCAREAQKLLSELTRYRKSIEYGEPIHG